MTGSACQRARFEIHHTRGGAAPARGARPAVAHRAAESHAGGGGGGRAGRPLRECGIHVWQAPPARNRPPRALPAQEARRHERGGSRRRPIRSAFFLAHGSRSRATTAQCVRHRIVGPDEFDREPGYISMDGPLARALMGKRLDDEVSVELPGARPDDLHDRRRPLRMIARDGPRRIADPLAPGACIETRPGQSRDLERKQIVAGGDARAAHRRPSRRGARPKRALASAGAVRSRGESGRAHRRCR